MFQTIYVTWHEPEGWVSKCMTTGVTSCGNTQEEAIAMLKEALELYYEDESSSEERVERKDFQFGSLTV
jgi:predicted RNase H-like HicB family nuclease